MMAEILAKQADSKRVRLFDPFEKDSVYAGCVFCVNHSVKFELDTQEKRKF
jgi:hypothetical protein